MRPASEWTDCRNRSQAGQDVFALAMHKWKNGGSFLEIGAADPVLSSNTCLLYDEFGWRGTAIELNNGYWPKWRERRPEDVFIADDATQIDYAKLLDGVDVVDYLSLDIDPPEATLSVLERLPFDKVRFGVITYEHDVWRGDDWPRYRSREILAAAGYRLVVPDVATFVFWPYQGPEPKQFEDWWVSPCLDIS